MSPATNESVERAGRLENAMSEFGSSRPARPVVFVSDHRMNRDLLMGVFSKEKATPAPVISTAL